MILDFIKFVFMMSIGIGMLVGGIMILGNVHGQYTCDTYQEITGKPTKYVNFDVCYIKTEAGWMRYPEYKARWTAHQGLTEVE